MGKSIADLYKRSKREAAARRAAAVKEATITRLAQMPASDVPIDERVQNLLAFSRPGVKDPAACLFKKCPSCGGHSIKSMGDRWYWCMSCGDRWQE